LSISTSPRNTYKLQNAESGIPSNMSSSKDTKPFAKSLKILLQISCEKVSSKNEKFN